MEPLLDDVSSSESLIKNKELISFLDTGFTQDLKPVKLCDPFHLIKHNISKVSDENKYYDENENSNLIKGLYKMEYSQEEYDLNLETESQYEPLNGNKIAYESTVEDINDIAEKESGYYSGNFLSFSSITDEESNTRDLESRTEIQSETKSQIDDQLSFLNRKHMHNHIDSQGKPFALAIPIEYVKETPITDFDSHICTLDVNEINKANVSSTTNNYDCSYTLAQSSIKKSKSSTDNGQTQKLAYHCNEICILPKYPSMRPLSVISEDSVIKLEYDNIRKKYQDDINPSIYVISFKECDNWSNRISIYGVPNEVSTGTEKNEDTEKDILGTSYAYHNSPEVTNLINNSEAFHKEKSNNEIKLSDNAKNKKIIPQTSVTKYNSFQPGVICFTNEDIKTTYSNRRGTKHLEGLRKLTMMLKQPSESSMQNNERMKLEVIKAKNIKKVQNNVLKSFPETVKSTAISLKTGYSLVRENYLPVSNEAEKKNPTKSFLTRVVRCLTIDNLKQFTFLILIFLQQEAVMPY